MSTPIIAKVNNWSPTHTGMTPAHRILCLLLLFVTLLPCIPFSHAAEQPPVTTPNPTLQLHEGTLTARITAVPLHQVMDEVARLTGVEVRWLNGDGTALVSVEFHTLPLSTALQRLLAGQNFMLRYRAGAGAEQLTQIWISAKSEAQGQPFSSPSAPLAAPSLPEEEATVEELLQAAQQEADSLSRVDSIEALGRYRDDPRVKSVLTHVAQNDRSPQVQEVATRVLEELE